MVLIVGHNPTMTSIASFSTGQHFQNVPTCGIVIVDYEYESWNELKIDSGTLRQFDFPKKNKDK
jgi:phosphohistidine phosphatase